MISVRHRHPLFAEAVSAALDHIYLLSTPPPPSKKSFANLAVFPLSFFMLKLKA